MIAYNGSNGQTYDTDVLTAPVDGVTVVEYAGTLQNGAPDGLALVNGTTVVEFLSYEGQFAATNGPATGLQSTNIGVSESGSGAIGNSLSKRFNPGSGLYEWRGEDVQYEGRGQPAAGGVPAL